MKFCIYIMWVCVYSVCSLWDVKSCQSTKHSWANLFTKPHKALILSPPIIVNFQCPFPFTAIQTQCVCGCVYRCLPRSWPGQWEHGRESTPHKGNVSGEVVNPDSPPTSLLQAKLCLETERGRKTNRQTPVTDKWEEENKDISLKDKPGDILYFVIVHKSQEKTKTNNDLILLTSSVYVTQCLRFLCYWSPSLTWYIIVTNMKTSVEF